MQILLRNFLNDKPQRSNTTNTNSLCRGFGQLLIINHWVLALCPLSNISNRTLRNVYLFPSSDERSPEGQANNFHVKIKRDKRVSFSCLIAWHVYSTWVQTSDTAHIGHLTNTITHSAFSCHLISRDWINTKNTYAIFGCFVGLNCIISNLIRSWQ
jgi:hypothetical protein